MRGVLLALVALAAPTLGEVAKDPAVACRSTELKAIAAATQLLRYQSKAPKFGIPA
jgi:hypothetical protein